MNSLLSGHVCIDYTPNCTNKIAFSTPTLYIIIIIIVLAHFSPIIVLFIMFSISEVVDHACMIDSNA